jgi:undecaprenyl-phosphate 4-deoxy-4-formamido-L-arabinose transferase
MAGNRNTGRLPPIATPVYLDATMVGPLVDALVEQLSDEKLPIILINDCSLDNSHEACLAIQRRLSDIVVYIRLTKNGGELNAVTTGLRRAKGEFVATMDDDFQNAPSAVSKHRGCRPKKGFDVVYSCYRIEKNFWLRNLGGRFNDDAANFMLNKPLRLYLSCLRCIGRFLVGEIVKRRGPVPYVDGLILGCASNIGRVEARHDRRREGQSGDTLMKLLRLWKNMFVDFSIPPLRVSGVLDPVSGSGSNA